MKRKIKPVRGVIDEKRTSELIIANKELSLLYEKQKLTELQLLHITTVLKAIRNVNQLITKERNPSILIRQACQKLVEGRGYHYARIVTLDIQNNLIEYADAALNDNYKIDTKIKNLNDLPFCMQQSLTQPEIFIADKTHAGCMQCSSGLEEVDCYSLSKRLDFENKIYGLLSVSIPYGFIFDKEEESLFLELAGDISFALATIKSEEMRMKSEDSLKLFRKLIDHSNDAIEVLDPVTGRFLDINEKGCMELGYTREEFLTLSVYDIDPMVDPKIFNNVREELRKTGHLLWEGIHLRKDGSTFPVEVNIKYVHLDREYMITVARDITERKLAEKKFLESVALNTTLVTHLPQRIFIKDTKSDYITCNNNYAKLLGITPEDIVGKNDFDFFPVELADAYRADDREVIKQGILKDIIEKYSQQGEQRWIHTIKVPYKDAANNIVGVLGIFEDITERKLAEDALEKAYNELENLHNNLDDAIFSVDIVNNKMLHVSIAHETVFGYPKAEFFKNPNLWYDITVDEDKPQIDANNAVLLSGKKLRQEFRILHSDGQIRWIEAKMTPTLNMEGNLIRVDGIATNISDRKQAEQELIIAKDRAEELSKVQSHFFSNMSHEMRTPMVGILGFANLLAKESYKEELRDMAKMIVSSGNRLMDTLNIILDLSQVKAGKQIVMKNEVSIPFVVYDSVELFSQAARQKNLYLKTNILDDDVTAEIDESLMIKITNNLINNAVKFTEKGGITVEVDSIINKHKKLAVLRVIDSGIGISDDAKDVIFEEFRQGSEGKDRNFDGCGLGLTISKKYVELMDGSISVESKVGFGSTFTVCFPALNYKGNKQDGSQQMIDSGGRQQEKIEKEIELPKILLVEDDLASRILTERYLKELCDIDYASNGEIALKMANNYQYPAIIMDINLGKGLSGLDVTEMIRNLENYEQTPIIALTAFAMVGDREEFLRKGCSYYISKPYEKEDICEIVDKILKNP